MENSIEVLTLLKKDTLKYDDKDMLHFSLKYPCLSETNPMYRIEGINKYYDELTSSLYKTILSEYYIYAKQNYDINKERQFAPYQIIQEFDILYNKNDILSIILSVYEYLGGAHGNTIYSPGTWDLKSGKKLTIHDIFKNPKIDENIIKEVERQVEENKKAGNNIYFDDVASLIRKEYNPDNYNLTPKGLQILYPVYTIAPYVAGPQYFIINPELLKP